MSKVMWVGRATSALVGLAILLVLAIGVANSALAHTNVDNKLFHLGHLNKATAPTSLISTLADAAKSALLVQNKSGGPALELRVGNPNANPPIPSNEVAPMKVNSNKVVTNLNADLVDGQQASAFAPSSHTHSDADITGTVGETKIDAAIARDAEVMDTVKANDGLGSGLDADLLDGKDSTAFVQGGGTITTFVHTATAANKLSLNGTDIDNPATNGNPNAVLLVTQKLNPSGAIYNNSPIGVYYNANRNRWEIFNQNNVAIPNGAQFNVLVVQPVL